MKKRYVIILLVFIIFLSGCHSFFHNGNIQKAGLLVEGSIHDQAWGEQGYKGLRTISNQYDAEIYYEEGIKSEKDIKEAVKGFVNKGVNLIFGHGNAYGETFVDIASKYPEVQFVYFNGEYYTDNVTSLNFNAHAMGFFGGMVAGEMTDTQEIGIIAAYAWQPEVEGFYEGVHYQNPNAEVHIDYVNDWDDTQDALASYKKMRTDDIDVVYPAGDSFSEDVIQQANNDDIYAFGYITDRSDIDEKTVLTSTIQHADKLYEKIAATFNDGEITGGVQTFDFQDDVISLSGFSSDVPSAFQKKVENAVAEYKKTGLLPHEQKP